MPRGGRGTERFLAAFEELERAGAVAGPEWLLARRRAALGRFAEVGFPASREEEWRYTSMTPMVEAPFRLPLEAAPNGHGRHALGRLGLGTAAWPRLVFVGGRLSAAGSAVPPLPAGVRVGSLADALRVDGQLIEPHLGCHAALDREGFTALNTACFQDGALVSVPPDIRLPEPIHVVFVGAPGVLAQPRCLVVAGPGSEATVVEHYVGPAGEAYLTNAVTEVVVGEGAVVRHCALEEEGAHAFHVRTVQVDQERDSTFVSGSVALGGRLVRQNLGVLFRGEGGTCTLDGLYVVGGGQHVDNHITVDHSRPRCASRQLYKGILEGHARA